jgi:hypothetical protein
VRGGGFRYRTYIDSNEVVFLFNSVLRKKQADLYEVFGWMREFKAVSGELEYHYGKKSGLDGSGRRGSGTR